MTEYISSHQNAIVLFLSTASSLLHITPEGLPISVTPWADSWDFPSTILSQKCLHRSDCELPNCRYLDQTWNFVSPQNALVELMFTQLSNFSTSKIALHNTWYGSTEHMFMYVHMWAYMHDSDKRQEEEAEGRDMNIWIVKPPPGFVISLHCARRALAVRVGKKNMQFSSLCFPSLGLSKPAGTPGDDMNKRQGVAKGNRHHGT